MGFSNKHNLLWSGELGGVAKTGVAKLKSLSNKFLLSSEKEISGQGSFWFLPPMVGGILISPFCHKKNAVAPRATTTKIIGIIILSFIKNFLSPKIQNMVRADVFNRFFGSFYRCGSAAFSEFRRGLSSPPQAAKCVRTIFRIQHHVRNCKEFWFASRSLSRRRRDSATK